MEEPIELEDTSLLTPISMTSTIIGIVFCLGISFLIYIAWSSWDSTRILIQEREHLDCILQHAFTEDQLEEAQRLCK